MELPNKKLSMEPSMKSIMISSGEHTEINNLICSFIKFKSVHFIGIRVCLTYT